MEKPQGLRLQREREREHNFIKPGPPLSSEQAAFHLHGDSPFDSKGNSFEPQGQADIVCAEHRMICFGRCIFFFFFLSCKYAWGKIGIFQLYEGAISPSFRDGLSG